MPWHNLVSPKRGWNGGGSARLKPAVGREPERESAQNLALHRSRLALCTLGLTSWLTGCDAPQTFVVLDNRYPASTANAPVVYQAFWQAISFQTPLPPGASSDPQSTIAASANLAYVVLAPGWDAASSTPPAALVVMQSRSGFSVSLNQTLHIPVDDATFAGNCAAGSSLSQAEAKFLTEIVFAGLFTTVSYDAASCTSTPKSDAGGS